MSDDDFDDLDALEAQIGHRFTERDLLRQALNHRSWCAEHPGNKSNERLEFLGDAVLGWAVADISYRRFEHTQEGQLTDLRKSVVNALALADVARAIDLGRHIRLGRGESAAGGSEKPSILSDAFEAVLGAVYLDGGAAASHAMVDRLVVPGFPSTIEGLDQMDNKTQLQERLARAGRGVPTYSVTSTGPDHAKMFVACVIVDGEILGEGSGRSKKAAEQLAATQACAALA